MLNNKKLKLSPLLAPKNSAILRIPVAPLPDMNDPDVRNIIPFLRDILLITLNRHNEIAIGVALPQIGLHYRGFIMSGELFDDHKERYCFNPSFAPGRNSNEYPVEEDLEGCLSLPGEVFKIKRYNRITAYWTDERGNMTSQLLIGLAAKCFQHEFDHLDGIMIDELYKKQNTPISDTKMSTYPGFIIK